MFINKKLFKNNIFLSVFLALIVFCIIYILDFSFLNYNLQKYFNKDWFKDDRIYLIKIDENTVNKLWWLPFDRKYYINLINNLNNAWATVIWFDLIFADWTNSDEELAKSIKNAWNIVLWWWKIQRKDVKWEFENPTQKLNDSAMLIGSFIVSENKYNNIIYSITPYQEFLNWKYEYFWISLLRAYYSKLFNNDKYITSKIKFYDNYININNINLPLSAKKRNEILINFENSTFDYESFYNIYNDSTFKYLQEKKWEKFLKDKIILIWSTLKWLDMVKTPISTINRDLDSNEQGNKSMLDNNYWVYIHANFLNTVLTKNFSKYFDKNLELLLILLLIILSTYVNLFKTWKKLIITNIIVIWFVIMYWSFFKLTRFVPNFPFELILSILLSSVLSNIAKYIIENKDKNKLNTALSEYVSKDIANEILSGEWNINLDWEKKRLAIFFSDIEGFTSISEKFSPEKLISFLKEYLTKMSEVILNQRWFINKYEWDAIMALWWVFWKSVEDISYEACITALIQKQRLIKLNTIWNNQWFPNINIRIWINAWDAIIWNIWSKSTKLEFTAIWDNVNLASRLESINKFYWTYICVSEAIYKDTKDLFEFRYLDKIKVKWKNIAINIYELLDSKWKLNESEKKIYDNFQKWINLYLDRNFKEALEIFEKLWNNWDKPSLVYVDRCKTFIKTPPPENWDQTWTMTEK